MNESEGQLLVTRREFIGTLGVLALPAIAGGAPPRGAVNLLAIGDWGAPPRANDPQDTLRKIGAQNRVAAAMADYAVKSASAGSPIDAVFPLGDDFAASALISSRS